MNKPAEGQKTTIASVTSGERNNRGKGELTDRELDEVSGGDEAPKETVTFEYGGLALQYVQQRPH